MSSCERWMLYIYMHVCIVVIRFLLIFLLQRPLVQRELQRDYWKEHSVILSLEAMMLDSQASKLDQEERPEVLYLSNDFVFLHLTSSSHNLFLSLDESYGPLLLIALCFSFFLS